MYSLMSIYSSVHRIQPPDSAARPGTLHCSGGSLCLAASRLGPPNIILFSKKNNTTYPNLWDTMKAVLRGKFIALSAQLKKTEKAHIENLTAHLKALEKKRSRITQEEKTGNNKN